LSVRTFLKLFSKKYHKTKSMAMTTTKCLIYKSIISNVTQILK